MSIVKVAESVCRYNLEKVDYKQVSDDAINLMTFLKDNKCKKGDQIYTTVKSIFWNVVMKMAEENEFRSN